MRSSTNKNLHVLFSGTFVVAIRTVKRFETFMDRILMSYEISAIRKTFVTFLASPGPEFFVDHFDVFYHVGLFVESVPAHITHKRFFLAEVELKNNNIMNFTGIFFQKIIFSFVLAFST